jgi:4-carboxymuconolactone decarboxylase
LSHLDETILQIVPFAGFARAINAFRVLQETAPHAPRRLERPGRSFRARGERLCRRIYGPTYTRMIERMRSYHPELAEWILTDGYGKVLARPLLSPRERELVIVATLAALRAPLQLASHALGALRVGARRSEIRAVLAGSGAPRAARAWRG